MAVKFYEIVEQVKLLSQDDKLYLKDILDKILIDEKRKAIKTHAEESVTEYREGKITFGTIAEMKRTSMRIETGFSSAFRKSFKNRIQQDEKLERKFWSRLDKFCEDPFDPVLKTHKLSGELKGLWSFSIEYDCRVIFEFIEDNKALFIDIGSHDEVY